MAFNLTYQQGSFGKSEDFSTLVSALGRASIVIVGNGCSNLNITEGGKIIRYHSQIVAECAATAL
jgi:hypothetical protein